VQSGIHFLTIATNIYSKFIPQLISSIDDAYGGSSEQIEISIFSDNCIDIESKLNYKVNHYFLKHKSWPYPTLERYKTFLTIKDQVDPDTFMIYTDADMLFKSQIPHSAVTKLFGVLHPGYFDKKRKPFTTSKKSSAYIDKSRRINYLCGGIQGGRAKEFFSVCEILSKIIEKDDSENQIPKWHDESYWNYYYANFMEEFTVLGPEYCWPEEWVTDQNPGKVIALTKTASISGTKTYLSGWKAVIGKIKRTFKKKVY
jgi:hypothetical protein